MPRTSKARINIIQVRAGHIKHKTKQDVVVTEEPLEIRLIAGNDTRQLAVTMRTPGADFELATGFLYSEGIIESHEDITHVSYCVDRDLSEEQRYNVVNVRLRQDKLHDLDHLERHFFTTSACGVCGKTSIEALEPRGLSPISSNLNTSSDIISQLNDTLRTSQALFETTGGLHAVGLFDNN
jgi:FdhD protein